MADEAEPRSETSDGLFSVRTRILENIVSGSGFEALAADGAWIHEDELDALLAVCRDVLESQAIADELAYILLHLGDDVIQRRRVYVMRPSESGRVELVAQSATTDELLRIAPHPVHGVRVVERGMGALRTPPRTYVDGKLVRRGTW